jgi:hypothetical protein
MKNNQIKYSDTYFERLIRCQIFLKLSNVVNSDGDFVHYSFGKNDLREHGFEKMVVWRKKLKIVKYFLFGGEILNFESMYFSFTNA